MNAPLPQPVVFHRRHGDSELARRLARAVTGDVLFDPPPGRYAPTLRSTRSTPSACWCTDHGRRALGHHDLRELAVPFSRAAPAARSAARRRRALVIDHSKHLDRILAVDARR